MSYTYNTTEAALRMPLYGRLVQAMVDRACALPDRAQRTRYAERIVRVMCTLNPAVRSKIDYRTIVWNHLAYIANYQLDIDYPCEITQEAQREHPAKLAYPGHAIRFRHYGHLLEQAIARADAQPAGTAARARLLQAAAARMRINHGVWKGVQVDSAKVCDDLALYTEGRIAASEASPLLESLRVRTPRPAANAERPARPYKKFKRY